MSSGINNSEKEREEIFHKWLFIPLTLNSANATLRIASSPFCALPVSLVAHERSRTPGKHSPSSPGTTNIARRGALVGI